MIDYEKLKTRRGLWKRTEQPGYVMRKCKVDGCEERHHSLGYCSVHYGRFKAHGDFTIVKKRSHAVYDSLDDYLTRNSKKQDNGCWEWTASKRRRGYGNAGSCQWAKQYKTGLAHRLSYIYYKGEFDYKLFVCHHCDNPSCINPEHLFLGTHEDNMKDMTSKGRKSSKGGEKGARSKLTKEQAIYILQNMETITAWELSTQFNVCRQTIQNIWRGITKYIEPELREQIIKEEYCEVSGAKLDKISSEHLTPQEKSPLLKVPYEDECQHESDGQKYVNLLPWATENIKYKCKKCGEFYR